MKKCIYTLLTDTKFDNPEHIVPAFLGGSEVFKNNVVSDIANKYFSKLEDRLAHKSVLSMLRDTYGPGKRGAKEFKSRPLIANYSQGKSLFVSTSGTNVTFLEQVILFF